MSRTRVITSPNNPQLKAVRRALRDGELTDEGYCVIEGPRMLQEARRSSCRIGWIFVTESLRGLLPNDRDLVVAVDDFVFLKLAGTESPQGMIALVEPPSWKIEQLFMGNSLVVALDGIQDPGNAGTIVRAAEAFGASGVIFGKGSVNPFNAKVVRASAGSLFRIPFVYGIEPAEALAAFEERGIEIVAGVPWSETATKLEEADLTGPCAVIVGNEGRGVGAVFQSAARPVNIPTRDVESLNAAIATAIILYEARRQRGYFG